MNPVHVLLVDDHPALRVGLRILLEQEPEIEVVGEAGDGAQALRLAKQLKPDVIVLDCELPGLVGSAVGEELAHHGISARILALSAYTDDRHVRGMLLAGASGYLVKDEAPAVIAAAVKAVARGEQWFSPAVASRLAAWARGGSHPLERLTEREREVLSRVAQGLTNKQIGRELGISEKGVEKHLSEVYAKLGVASRAAAAAWAVREGLG